MQYCSNMSAERDSMSGVNNENAIKLGYFYPSGRLSPSSWDDSNEEQSDVDSSVSVGQEKLAKDEITIGDFFPVDIPIEDRRKSLARMRRRTRSGSSPVSDIVKGKDSSESCDESDDSSPKRSTRKYEEVTSPDQLPVSQSGNDSNSDEIISNIENYPCEKSFSPIKSKLACNQSNVSKCVTLLNGIRANQSGTSEDDIEFRSNLDSKLSKIVEVEENGSNMGLRTSKTPRSAVPVCFQMDYVGCNADNNFSYSEAQPIPEISETEEKTVPVEFISEEKLINLTDQDDSDDSDLWKKIRSKVRRKNSHYSMNYEDSQYITRSLKFIFDEKERHKASSDDGSETKDENVKRVTLNKGKFENEGCADEISENRNGEMPFTGVPDSSDGMLNNASSKETVDFGLENLFCVGRTVPEYCSAVSYAADGSGMGKDVKGSTPRSGRETFLIRECSMAWKLPSNGSGNKRVRSNHTISLSMRDKLTDCMKCTDQSFYADDDRDRNQIEEVNADAEIPVRRHTQTSPRKMTDFWFSSTDNSLIDNSNWMKNAGNNDVNRNDSNQSSPTSFRSKILLDLDLSDNEEKCSTMERIIFSDSPDNLNKSFTPRNEKITTSCPSKNSAGIEQKTTEIGKWGMRESMEFDNRKAYVHNYDQFEIGDNKWNRYEKSNRKINLPQDRGDITYEKPDTQADWGNLITSLECRGHDAREKSKENVFWIDLRADPMGAFEKFKRPENPSESDWLGPKWESRFGKSKISLDESGSWNSNEPPEKSHFSATQNPNCRRKKAKKRKRVNLPTDAAARQRPTGTDLRNRWGDRLFDGRGNWLVNNVTRRKDVLTRGKQWIQTLILTRRRNCRTGGYQQKWQSNNRPISKKRNKSTDCFSNLFKQFVNIFTVSPKTRK